MITTRTYVKHTIKGRYKKWLVKDTWLLGFILIHRRMEQIK